MAIALKHEWNSQTQPPEYDNNNAASGNNCWLYNIIAKTPPWSINY